MAKPSQKLPAVLLLLLKSFEVFAGKDAGYLGLFLFYN